MRNAVAKQRTQHTSASSSRSPGKQKHVSHSFFPFVKQQHVSKPKATSTTAWLIVGLVITSLCGIAVQQMLQCRLFGWQSQVFHVRDLVDLVESDVMIIPGYAISHDLGIPSVPLKQRLDTAADILCTVPKTELNRPPWIIVFSGGSPQSQAKNLSSEAQVMRAYFEQEWKLKHSADQCVFAPTLPQIVLEENSTSTRENAIESIKAIAQVKALQSMKQFVVITNKFHQWRAKRVFQKAVLEHSVAKHIQVRITHLFHDPSNPHASDGVTQLDFWRECAAIVYYKIRGFI